MKALIFLAALSFLQSAAAHDRESIMLATKQALVAKTAQGNCLVTIENKSLTVLGGTYDVLISPHTPFSKWNGKCDFKDMTLKLFRQIPGTANPSYGPKVQSSSVYVDLGSDGLVDAYASGEVGPKVEIEGQYLAVLQDLFGAKK